MPASVSVLDAAADQAVAGRRRRRRAAAGADVQPVPPHEQPGGASDRRRACRCAASGRAASAARSCCSTTCRSTTRSAAGCTGRACRSTASIASRSSTARARASTATTRWAASSTSSAPARRAGPSSSSRSTATATRRRSTSSAATSWGKLGVSRSKASCLDTDGFPIVAEAERGPIDTNANVTCSRTSTRRLDYAANDRLNASSAAGYFSEERDNAQGHDDARRCEGNDTSWKHGERRRRMLLPDQSDLQARVFADDAELPQQLPRGPEPATTRNIGAADARPAGADQGRRRHGAVGARVRHAALRSARGPTGAGSTATARRTRCDAVDRATNVDAAGAISGGTQQSLGRVRAGHLHADAESCRHAERARRPLAELRRPQPGDHGGRPGRRRPDNRPTLPDGTDTVVSPRVGGAATT